MKLTAEFANFLDATVNLNTTRIETLEGNVTAIQKFVRQSDWGPVVRGFEHQGSWAHDTIIKPVDGGEFDADLLVMVDPVEGWTAADYVKELRRVFKASPTYKDKSKAWDYCVTVTYAGDQKVDVAPCVVSRTVAGRLEVCNRSKDAFERSEPVAYTAWMVERNGYSGLNSFRKVTRLLKYLRDVKVTFSCPSVLLTTLIGYRIEAGDKGSDAFKDVPTSLQTIVHRLDDYLQARPSKPAIRNPELWEEDLGTLWKTDRQYANFRSFVNKYRGWIDEAVAAVDVNASIIAWRKVFGDEFAKGRVVTARLAVNEGVTSIAAFLRSSAAHMDQIVGKVRDFGTRILPASFTRPPHLQEPPWPRADFSPFDVYVSAAHHGSKDAVGSPVVEGDTLPARGGLWFSARLYGGHSIPAGHRVEWRITNTGQIALGRGQGRGGFYHEQRDARRWEELQYHGIHMAEAFVIRRADETLVSQSEPFYVIVD